MLATDRLCEVYSELQASDPDRRSTSSPVEFPLNTVVRYQLDSAAACGVKDHAEQARMEWRGCQCRQCGFRHEEERKSGDDAAEILGTACGRDGKESSQEKSRFETVSLPSPFPMPRISSFSSHDRSLSSSLITRRQRIKDLGPLLYHQSRTLPYRGCFRVARRLISWTSGWASVSLGIILISMGSGKSQSRLHLFHPK